MTTCTIYNSTFNEWEYQLMEYAQQMGRYVFVTGIATNTWWSHYQNGLSPLGAIDHELKQSI